MGEVIYLLILLLNGLWFGSGFWYFALKRQTAAKLLIPRSSRDSPLFLTMTAALPFLGGMNLALSLLSFLVLISRSLFQQPAEQAILLLAFGVAHATQFLINVPVARRGGRQGEAYWDVLHGPMLFIFVVDALLTVANVVCAVALFTTD